MSQLYTNLVMVKTALNDGHLPPMTPVPEKIQHIINPEFVPGLGALHEDERGLQCPVCVVWMHKLGHHISRTHSDKGGLEGIKRMMGMPTSVTLTSVSAKEAARTAALRVGIGKWVKGRPIKKGRRKGRRKRASMSERNFRNTCHAQIGHRLWDLRNKLGRSPTITEANALDQGLGGACVMIYGTWNAGKAIHGLDSVPRGRPASSREAVLASLSAWVKVHGRLPGSMEVSKKLLPILPVYATILKHFKADSWKEAMRKAAISVGIHDRRYRPKPKEVSA